jgi:uncharacterized protein YggE
MKKIALILVVLASGLASAQGVQQQQNLQPQINVSGEGKVKVMPDQATIIIGVDNVGANAAEVKKKNDEAIDAIIKYLKGIKLPEADYQTQRVNLNRTYDYDKKKFSFTASQTIQINLKDLTKYDALMMGVVDAGANNIEGIQFKTSKQAQYESEARVKAVQQARGKANDYAGALGVKVGKAIVVTDNSQTYYPVMRGAMYKEMTMADMPKATLAIGEIEITANVNIIFSLD